MNLKQADQFRQQMLSKGARSDGCTMAPELGTPCCEMHDFLRRYLPDDPENLGHKITPRQADNLLFKCIVKKGRDRGLLFAPGYFILACIYWLVVRLAYDLKIFK